MARFTEPLESATRKKTSITLKDDLWWKFQDYSLAKNRNARSANTELEFAMQNYMKTNPIKKENRK